MSWHQATLLSSCPLPWTSWCWGAPGKALFLHPPVSRWSNEQTLLLVSHTLHSYFLLIFYNYTKSGTPHTEYEDSNTVQFCSSTVLSAKRGSMSKGCFKSRVCTRLALSRRWSVPLVLKEEVRKQIANRRNDRKYRWPLKNVGLCGSTYIFFFFNSKYSSTPWSESC